MRADAGLHYIRRNFDEAAILAVAAKLAFETDPSFSDSELATIAAMQRANPQAGESHEALGEWLSGLDAAQVAGVVSNTKGVLHEMEFVRLENEDGDSIYASMFESASHPGFDVTFVDVTTGVQWEAQLKATDQEAYVREWIDVHPDGEILVTRELAEEMDLPTTGLSNGELTTRTEDVVDRLIAAGDDDDMWDYFPGLAVASIALVVFGLWQRYRRQEITLARFKWLAAKATGLKAGKLALLSAAMMVPGLNIATGAALIASMMFSGAEIVRSSARRFA